MQQSNIYVHKSIYVYTCTYIYIYIQYMYTYIYTHNTTCNRGTQRNALQHNTICNRALFTYIYTYIYIYIYVHVYVYIQQTYVYIYISIRHATEERKTIHFNTMQCATEQYVCTFIGKVVLICLVGSVNSVLKFLGQPGDT